MIVYGDRSFQVAPRERAGFLLQRWREAADSSGLARHAGLVGAFIGLGEVVQGIADAAFQRSGVEERDPAAEAANAALVEMARGVIASWDSGFAVAPPADLAAAGRFLATPLPDRITCRRPEGYAYYALYPEAYAEAAGGLQGGASHVIGLRSIGTGLAAMVAARLGAPTPATLRPHGHPFRRRIAPGPALAAEWLAHPAARFAVVDEGPGLSGSSFGAVCDWLEQHGVHPNRTALFPSHGNPPGPQAAEHHRRRWPGMPRFFVDVDRLILDASAPAHRLDRWVSDLLGEPMRVVRDLSGGAWRAALGLPEEAWPAVDTFQERRKLLLDGPAGPVLARFAGLGELGPAALARAGRLAGEGLVPQPLGLVHGFLVERWHADARPLSAADGRRPEVLAAVARVLGTRARAFPAPPGSGATLPELAGMALHNGREALGAAAARPLERLAGEAESLERTVQPVETDNRLMPHEWLATQGGRILKADALDHHAGHDLVGCQDPAWDVAGAALEFGLDGPTAERLRAMVSDAAGRAVDPKLVAFCRPCYAAFRLGALTLAASAHGGHPAERARLEREAGQWAARLRAEIGPSG